MTELTTPVAIDVTKAELTIALSKEGLQYQQLLQEGESLTFTKDKLVEQGASLKKLREVQKKLADKENPYTANWKAWNEARKSLVDPVADLLKRKESEYRKLALEIESDKKREAEEKERVAGIKTAIDSFFIAQSQSIAGAKTLPELTAIEKIIGSHKANKSRYSEFLPELVAKAELLTPLIKEQKKVIRELEALKEAEEKALQSGDDQAAIDAVEAQQSLQNKFDEVNIKAQEQAVNMATKVDTVVVPEVVLPAAPKPRRSVWTYESVDINETLKKMPSFVDLSLNKEKVDEYLKAKKAEGIEGEEFTVFGIRFFLNKSF